MKKQTKKLKRLKSQARAKHNAKKVFLNFYGIEFVVISPDEKILEDISFDFHGFVSKVCSYHATLIQLEKSEKKIPTKKYPIFWGKNSSSSFDERGSLHIFPRGTQVLYKRGENILVKWKERGELREVIYLVLSSVVGKELDRKGVHRLHASSVWKKKDQVLQVFTGSSGSGKSTRFFKEIEESHSVPLTDDILPISLDLIFFSYPMRFGIPRGQEKRFSQFETSLFFRQRYPCKTLVRSDQVAGHSWFLAEYKDPKLELVFMDSKKEKVNFLYAWLVLQKNLVVGFGVPIILEIFWEHRWSDLLVRVKIFISRTILSLKLIMNAKELLGGRSQED